MISRLATFRKIFRNSVRLTMDTNRKRRYYPCTGTQGAGLTDNQQGAMAMNTAAVLDADGTFNTCATVYFRGTVADCKAYVESRRNVQVLVGCTKPAGSQVFRAELSYMLARKLWRNALAFAVVPTQGRYDSGDAVRIAETASDLSTARAIASRLTKEYQSMMKPHGGSNGGYRVIAWGSVDSTIDGYILDRTPDAK